MRFNMANDLSDLCGNLSLTEKEKTKVEIEVGDIEATILHGKCCLLGKVVVINHSALMHFVTLS